MARVTDTIAATVVVKGDQANASLAALSKNARKTGSEFDGFADGARRSTSSLGVMRGGTVALAGGLGALGGASAGVAGGVALLAGGLISAASAQSALVEATNAATVTFKDATGQVAAFADSASRIGLSKRAALEAATGFGALLTGLGYTTQAAADFSVSLTKLSADLASVFGGSVEDASKALRAMFRGEFDPIEKYGVKVSAASAEQRALQMGLAGTASALSEQDKALARVTLAYSQTINAQGDFNRTQADTANQSRIAAAQLENLRARTGSIIDPVKGQLIAGFNASLGFLDKQAQKSGTTLGEFAKKWHGYTTVLGFIGSKTKDSAENFKDSKSALETFAQELAVGREGSEAYTAAITYLRKANADAELANKKLAAAIGGQTAAQKQAREEAQQSLGAVQALNNALRAAEDADMRVTDSRKALADAERSLSDLRAKGKVDAEQVADAEQRVADAAQSTIDARQRQVDAERRLADLRARGAIDAERVVDSERSVIDATRSVVSARKALIEAEKEVARLRAGPTEDEAKDAARAIVRAQLDLERAQQRQVEAQQALNESRGADTLGASLGVREAELALVEATEALADAQQAQVDLQNRGKDGSVALAEAEDQLAEARHRAEEAVRRQTEAEADLRAAQLGDPEFAANLAAAEREVDAARRGVEAAVRAEDKAAADLRKARAGDPEFERNLARAVDEHTRALRDVERADKDLVLSKKGAEIAQDDFNAKVSEATGLAEQMRRHANELGIAYNRLEGEAFGAAAGVERLNEAFRNAGAARPGIVGGFAGPAAGFTGRRTAATPAFTTAPRASATSSTIVVPVTIDGREVARVVTRHQNDLALRG